MLRDKKVLLVGVGVGIRSVTVPFNIITFKCKMIIISSIIEHQSEVKGVKGQDTTTGF